MAMTVSAAEGALVVDLDVDTSAVLAVLLREPSCEGVLERLCRASQPAVAAPTRTEILLVALVKLGEVGQERARRPMHWPRRLVAFRPFSAVGSTAIRNTGRSAGSVVIRHTVTESRAVKASSRTITTGLGLLA